MERAGHIFTVTIIVIAILITLVCFGICAVRWWMVDDANDILGNWRNQANNSTVEITAEKIKLSEDMICTYKLVPAYKAMDVALGTESGRSHYVFSPDKSELVIIDEDLDFFSSLSLDVTDAVKNVFTGKASASSAGFVNTDISSEKISRLKKIS